MKPCSLPSTRPGVQPGGRPPGRLYLGAMQGSGEIPETEIGDRVKATNPPPPPSQIQDIWFCVNQLIRELLFLMSFYEREHVVLFAGGSMYFYITSVSVLCKPNTVQVIESDTNENRQSQLEPKQ